MGALCELAHGSILSRVSIKNPLGGGLFGWLVFSLSRDVPLDIESISFVPGVGISALPVPADHVGVGLDRIAQRSDYLPGFTASPGVHIDLDGVTVDVRGLPQVILW
jgi:hypothetical protein